MARPSSNFVILVCLAAAVSLSACRKGKVSAKAGDVLPAKEQVTPPAETPPPVVDAPVVQAERTMDEALKANRVRLQTRDPIYVSLAAELVEGARSLTVRNGTSGETILDDVAIALAEEDQAGWALRAGPKGSLILRLEAKTAEGVARLRYGDNALDLEIAADDETRRAKVVIQLADFTAFGPTGVASGNGAVVEGGLQGWIGKTAGGKSTHAESGRTLTLGSFNSFQN